MQACPQGTCNPSRRQVSKRETCKDHRTLLGLSEGEDEGRGRSLGEMDPCLGPHSGQRARIPPSHSCDPSPPSASQTPTLLVQSLLSPTPRAELQASRAELQASSPKKAGTAQPRLALEEVAPRTGSGPPTTPPTWAPAPQRQASPFEGRRGGASRKMAKSTNLGRGCTGAL